MRSSESEGEHDYDCVVTRNNGQGFDVFYVRGCFRVFYHRFYFYKDLSSFEFLCLTLLIPIGEDCTGNDVRTYHISPEFVPPAR